MKTGPRAVLARATDAEVELLALVLREVRHARANTEQLNIVIDPWTKADGLHFFFCYSAAGWSGSIEGRVLARRSKRGKVE